MYSLYLGLPGEDIINMKPKYPIIFDHLEFISLDAHVNVRLDELLPFVPGRNDCDLILYNIDIHPIFVTPIGYFQACVVVRFPVRYSPGH